MCRFKILNDFFIPIKWSKPKFCDFKMLEAKTQKSVSWKFLNPHETTSQQLNIYNFLIY